MENYDQDDSHRTACEIVRRYTYVRPRVYIYMCGGEKCGEVKERDKRNSANSER